MLWVPLAVGQTWSGRQPTGDAPHLLGTAMRLGWELRSLELSAFVAHWFTLLAPHPPGAYLLPSVLYTLLGPAAVVPLLASLICLALIWDAVLRMLRAMDLEGAGQRWGVALCLAAAPLVWREVELFGLDLLAAAFVAQCLSRLMASRGLTVRREAVLAGAWLGLGFWIKYTFPVFLFFPCLAVAGGIAWDRLRGRPGGMARIKNGLWLVLALVLAAGPLFVVQGRGIIGYVLRSLAPTANEAATMGGYLNDGSPGIPALDRHLRYLGALKDLWGWPGLALLVAGLVLLVMGAVRGSRRGGDEPGPPRALRAAALCLCCALGGFVLLSVFVIKLDRYMLPMLAPLLAVLLPPLWHKRVGPPLVLVAMVPPLLLVGADYLGLTQGQSMDRGLGALELNLGAQTPAPPHRALDNSARKKLTTWGRYPLPEERYRPISQDFSGWGLHQAIQQAASHMPPHGGSLGFLVQDEMRSPSFGVLLMATAQAGYPWDIVTVKLLPAPSRPAGFSVFHFVGPFFRGQPPTFTALVAIHEPRWPMVEQYLRTRPLRQVHQHQHGGTLVRVLAANTR